MLETRSVTKLADSSWAMIFTSKDENRCFMMLRRTKDRRATNTKANPKAMRCKIVLSKVRNRVYVGVIESSKPETNLG